MVSAIGNRIPALAFATALPAVEDLPKPIASRPVRGSNDPANRIRLNNGRRIAQGSAPTRAPTDKELRPDPPTRKKIDVQVPTGSDGRIKGTTLDLTSQLLSKNQGVFIGETHANPMARDFLRSDMPSLKQQGVKALFVECIEKKNQGFLDAFYRSKTPADEQRALARLESVLQSTWGYDTQGYMALIQSAKQNGVRVFGIDERKGPFANRVPEDGTRETTWRNQFWARATNDVMSKEFGKQDKFVVLGGSGHSGGKLSYSNEGQGSVPIYGADYALQIPTIRFTLSNGSGLSPGGYPTNRTPYSRSDVEYYVIGAGENIGRDILRDLPLPPFR